MVGGADICVLMALRLRLDCPSPNLGEVRRGLLYPTPALPRLGRGQWLEVRIFVRRWYSVYVWTVPPPTWGRLGGGVKYLGNHIHNSLNLVQDL